MDLKRQNCGATQKKLSSLCHGRCLSLTLRTEAAVFSRIASMYNRFRCLVREYYIICVVKLKFTLKSIVY